MVKLCIVVHVNRETCVPTAKCSLWGHGLFVLHVCKSWLVHERHSYDVYFNGNFAISYEIKLQGKIQEVLLFVNCIINLFASSMRT